MDKHNPCRHTFEANAVTDPDLPPDFGDLQRTFGQRAQQTCRSISGDPPVCVCTLATSEGASGSSPSHGVRRPPLGAREPAAAHVVGYKGQRTKRHRAGAGREKAPISAAHPNPSVG